MYIHVYNEIDGGDTIRLIHLYLIVVLLNLQSTVINN